MFQDSVNTAQQQTVNMAEITHSTLSTITAASLLSYTNETLHETLSSKPERTEQSKEGGIMGGDWRRVISKRRRGATCSVEVIARMKPSYGTVVVKKEHRQFCTGSYVHGQIGTLGVEGECMYTMEHDVTIDGEMHDGEFHGVGTLIYPNGGRVDGMFNQGILTPATYTFADGLVFEPTDWTYCSCLPPDRRFLQEIKFGLKPVCTSLKTQHQPTRTIPEGCYDTGDGFYSPKTRCVTSQRTGQIIRIPTNTEAAWIMKYCRKAWDETSGYRPTMNDSFTEDDVNYAPLLIEKRRRSILQHQKSEEEMKLREEICRRIGLHSNSIGSSSS